MRSILYYTDHSLPPDLAFLCAGRLQDIAGDGEIVTVGLNKPAPFGTRRLTVTAERGTLTMFRQILAGLQATTGNHVFMCEHDVLYHPSHFNIEPMAGVYHYNTNVWHVRWPDGRAVRWDNCQQVSGLCADRDLLLDFYSQRIAQIERDGFNRHYEPGLKQTVGGRVVANWQSEKPNLDIRHNKNLTLSKWSIADFRNKHYAKGWQELDIYPGWIDVSPGVME